MNLTYHGRELNQHACNRSLENIARDLNEHAQPVIVILEPGDATSYQLLLVPAWAPSVAPFLGRFGITPANAPRFLYVAKLESDGCDFIPVDGKLLPHHFEELSKNDWTCEVLAWWFTHLVVELEKFAALPIT